MQRKKDSAAELNELLQEILTDAYGQDEQLWALHQAFDDNVNLPADAYVIGEPVSVVAVDYDGNERRGMTARCRRGDGSEHVVAAPDVVFVPGSDGARYVAAYRQWLGLDPYPAEAQTSQLRKRQPKAMAEDIDLSKSVELVALAIKGSAARCRLLGSDKVITLRATRLWHVVPGDIVTVKPSNQWRFGGHPYLSGEIESTRLDVAALDLVPLRLEDMGMWDPEKEYWGEDDEPIEDWAIPIIARGPRPQFEMEQVLPGEDLEDYFSDPIIEAVDFKEAGHYGEARKILMELCQTDLRCLDAHAHLGNLVIDHWPKDAIRHYEVGLGIGELSLGKDFDGLLPWGLIDNRPFLRCLHGYGLCLWRLGRIDEAGRVFERMLWLNPSDNLGARFLMEDLKAGRKWEETQDNDDRWERKMKLKTLQNKPPWEWPEDAGETLLEVLTDEGANDSDRILAAELACDLVTINEDLVAVLMSTLWSDDESEELRGKAAIALGPVLEEADTMGFEDPEDALITENTFKRIQKSLKKLYLDTGVPKYVRRRALEASVRAPQAWHKDAIQAAYKSYDEDWELTAVFAMRWVRGFKDQILEALESENLSVRCEAVCATGNWELDAAWPHVAELVTAPDTDKSLLLAAIDAAVSIRPQEAGVILLDLIDSEDPDISEAAYEALEIAEGPSD